MKRKNLYSVVATILVVAAAGFGAYGFRSPDKPAPVAKTTSAQTTKAITISTDGKTVSYTGQAGQTALAELKALTTVQTQTSSYGEFVTSIHGLTADAKTQYWAFYINGKSATEGAGTYQTTNSDHIQWRLEQL